MNYTGCRYVPLQLPLQPARDHPDLRSFHMCRGGAGGAAHSAPGGAGAVLRGVAWRVQHLSIPRRTGQLQHERFQRPQDLRCPATAPHPGAAPAFLSIYFLACLNLRYYLVHLCKGYLFRLVPGKYISLLLVEVHDAHFHIQARTVLATPAGPRY